VTAAASQPVDARGWRAPLDSVQPVSGSEPPVSLRPARVAARSLAEIATRIGVSAPADAALTGVTHDSRRVKTGDLYVALPGSHAHGASFARQAEGAGATAIMTDDAGRRLAADVAVPVLVVDDPRRALGPVASWIYGEPSKRMRVLGVTGTNGKTTTSYLLEAGLRGAGETAGLIGTIETRVGDDAVPSVRTTPEASDLQALLAVMAERGARAVAMEVSSHALALHRVDATAFGVVGFTNLSQDHLDFHGDLEHYFAAKARLFTSEFAARGVVNLDDEHGRRLLADATIDFVSFSAAGHPDADWRASAVTASPSGTRFVAAGPGVEIEVSTRLVGAFNVANTLAAVAMLAAAEVDLDNAVAGMARMPGVPGRMERVEAGQPFAVVVDYAHTPEAVATALETVRPAAPGRVVVVLGCGGDRDVTKRPLMGAAAARLADVAVLTSDNPRSEQPRAILDAVVAGANDVPAADRAEIIAELDRAVAIQVALATAKAGDVVVIAGKGHEQGQEIAGVTHPFDDRAVAREALARLGFWESLA
jgi:UDP-N-acetylmuramoyl-L-alanyl-D-glutamate--2,6-diaminopimelate ligase